MAAAVPDHPVWLHEVKYDGYRLRLEREGNRVRLITRGGYNWADRYPRIVEAALKNRHQRFVIDGEAVVLGVDGIADFNAPELVRACATSGQSGRSSYGYCTDIGIDGYPTDPNHPFNRED